jgi:uncharacterized protein (TIGR03086 family)
VDRFEADRQALAWAGSVVAEVRPEHLDRPTPCPDWTLAQLLGHMVAHNHGFTAALRGAPVGAPVWDSVTLPPGEPAEVFDASAAGLTEAFAGAFPERIEVYGYGAFGVDVVLGMHIVDFVAHGWDVARAIGSDRRPDDALAGTALEIMKGFPDRRPNKAFDVVVPVPDDAPEPDRLMGWLGRDPGWRAPLR